VIAHDEDGETISSCIVFSDGTIGTPTKFRKKGIATTETETSFFLAAEVDGILDSEGRFSGLHVEKWRPYFHKVSTGDGPGAKKKRFQDGRNDLIARGELTAEDDIYRLAGPMAGLLENEIAKKLRQSNTRHGPGTNAEQSTASRPTETEQPEHTALGSVPCSGVAIGVSNQKKRRWKKRDAPAGSRRTAMNRTAEPVPT
jgi:hypothetical protein